ncbi:MAG: hypothetical protein IJM93_00065 [Oscillospiraceae bacterium]|nr:hypothetical protein [Oscillospiraceae bacterium]
MKRKILLFLLGGIGYCLLELLWRGRTHWSMGICGGLCLIGISRIDKLPLSLWKKSLCAAALITAVELYTGIAVNLWLRWNVWDYSGMWLNFYGQICPLFSFFWLLLSLCLFALMRLIHCKGKAVKKYLHGF